MQGAISDISEFNLSDSKNFRECLLLWEFIVELSHDYPRVLDLKMEIESKWERATLTDEQRRALRLYLLEGLTQKETGKRMDIGTRWVARLVSDGLEILAATDGR